VHKGRGSLDPDRDPENRDLRLENSRMKARISVYMKKHVGQNAKPRKVRSLSSELPMKKNQPAKKKELGTRKTHSLDSQMLFGVPRCAKKKRPAEKKKRAQNERLRQKRRKAVRLTYQEKKN